MEILTDILAIVGFTWAGGNIPSLCEIVSGRKSASGGLFFEMAIASGLIAASLVLG